MKVTTKLHVELLFKDGTNKVFAFSELNNAAAFQQSAINCDSVSESELILRSVKNGEQNEQPKQ